jgi:hypothetical protein
MKKLHIAISLVAWLSFAVLVAATVKVSAQNTRGQAWAVFDGACLADVSKKAETRIEAPFEHGEPNMKKALLVRPAVKIVPGCFKIEVRQ